MSNEMQYQLEEKYYQEVRIEMLTEMIDILKKQLKVAKARREKAIKEIGRLASSDVVSQ